MYLNPLLSLFSKFLRLKHHMMSTARQSVLTKTSYDVGGTVRVPLINKAAWQSVLAKTSIDVDGTVRVK